MKDNNLIKDYIGDGIYVEYDGYHIIIYASNGIESTKRIYLNPDIFQNLINFRNRMEQENKTSQE